MEDILDLYAEPYDPNRPQVCLDEVSYQRLTDVREPLPVRRGRPRRQDYEYERHGTANLFVALEPQAGQRVVAVTERRTAVDFAHFIKHLVDDCYPEATVIRLVLDNLNTHSPASLYEAFPAAEARRLTRKLELHPTPKHASWLNAAEIEIGVLGAAVPQAPDRPSRHAAGRGGRVRGQPQRATGEGRLELHDQQSAGEVGPVLRPVITVAVY
jgi:hypothetical protein